MPQDWTTKEMPIEGPGMPEDWPLERSVALFPEAWAERFEHNGPPSPDALPSAPAISLEVYVGPMEQFRRAFPEPTAQKIVEVNGLRGVQEIDVPNDEIQLLRYVFQDPEEPNVRVVLIDNYSGFVERREAEAEVAELIPTVVSTFSFED